MTQHALQLTTKAVAARVEESAGKRLQTQGLEVIAAYELRLRHVRAIAGREAHGKKRAREQRCDIAGAARQLAIFAQRERPRAGLQGITESDHDQLIGLVEWKRPEQKAVDDRESGGVGASRNPQTQKGRYRPSRPCRQQADRGTKVAEQRIDYMGHGARTSVPPSRPPLSRTVWPA